MDEHKTHPEQRANGPNGYDKIPEVSPKPRADLVALDDALKRLAAVDERKSRVVELRYFGGLSVEETGEVLIRWRTWAAISGGVLIAFNAIIGYLLTRPLPPPRVLRTVQLTNTNRPKSGVVTDGTRIYALDWETP